MFAPFAVTLLVPLTTLQRILPTNFIVRSNKRHTENTRIISSRFLYRDHLAPRTLSIKEQKKIGEMAIGKKGAGGGNLIGKDGLSARNFSHTSPPPIIRSLPYSQSILTEDLHDQKKLGLRLWHLVLSVNYTQGTLTSKCNYAFLIWLAA